MITLHSARDQEKVVDAITAANNGEGVDVRLSLTAHTETPHDGAPVLDDLSPRMTNGEWGQAGLPITLDASIAGYLPRRLRDAKMRLIAEVEGVPIDQLHGEKTMFLPGADAYTTDLITTSAGSLFEGRDSVKLNAFTEYPGVPAHLIVLDAVSRLPYVLSAVVIEPAPGVELVWVGHTASPGLHAHEPVGEILNRLSATVSVGYLYRDLASGGFAAWIPPALGTPQPSPTEIPNHRRYASAQLPNWDLQRPMPPAERYTDVRVYRMDPTDGSLLWEVFQEVPYPPDAKTPHAGRTLHIRTEDASDDGPYHGNQRAIREALEIARQVSTGTELILPSYDPLIETHDPLLVTEPFRDDDGLWEVVWDMRADSYRHLFDGGSSDQGGSLSTKVAYSATVLSEERINTPALLVPRPTTGVIGSPRPSYGLEGDELYFDQPTPWVATLGDDLIFDTDNNGNAALAGDEILVNE